MKLNSFENEQFLFMFTNVMAWVTVMLLLGVAILIERKRLKDTKVLHIAIVGTICGLAAILTNLLGYNITMFSVSVKLSLGQWLIFIVGLFYGPTLGVVAGICSDLVGSLLGLGGGAFHAGFMLCTVIIGLAGGITLLFGRKHILLKGTILYAIAYMIQSLLLNPIWLFSMGYGSYVYADMVMKLIKLPASLFIYISLISATYFVFIQILKRMNDEDSWWYLKTKGVSNEV